MTTQTGGDDGIDGALPIMLVSALTLFMEAGIGVGEDRLPGCPPSEPGRAGLPHPALRKVDRLDED